MRSRCLAATLLSCLAALPVLAQQRTQSGAGSQLPCTCRAQGQSFDLGATICMETARGPRLAVCDMVLNNTSWRPTEQTCPQAALSGMPAG